MRRVLPMGGPCRALPALAVLGLLAACAGGAAQGRWVGVIRPEPGSLPAPGCRGESRGTLTVNGDKVLFTPGDGTAVLTGTVDGDGRMRASLSRTGADRKPYVLRFEGAVAGGEATGTYAAPGCRAAVALRPA